MPLAPYNGSDEHIVMHAHCCVICINRQNRQWGHSWVPYVGVSLTEMTFENCSQYCMAYACMLHSIILSEWACKLFLTGSRCWNWRHLSRCSLISSSCLINDGVVIGWMSQQSLGVSCPPLDQKLTICAAGRFRAKHLYLREAANPASHLALRPYHIDCIYYVRMHVRAMPALRIRNIMNVRIKLHYEKRLVDYADANYIPETRPCKFILYYHWTTRKLRSKTWKCACAED